MSKMEKLLESVATQIAKELEAEFDKPIKPYDRMSEGWPDPNSYDLSKVLKARLLPLLEAGEMFLKGSGTWEEAKCKGME
ncbi:MAG: hypothetical protein PVS2B2_26770 [Candidatus Acidiferrum sp.]